MRYLYLLLLVIAACYSPTFTHCPDVDCPEGRVCDGQGGCALQGQVDACTGAATGDACTYGDPTGKSVAGECTMQGVCLPIGCGNGVVTPDEVCDDGNNVSGDGCSADCHSNETCGNGTVDSAAGEQCDDGNTLDGDGCQHDCKQARCGDGVTDTVIGEECDAGSANSTAPDSPCRPSCQLPRCGDSVIDPAHGEVCDDGNNQSADGCSGDCKSNETCGNHVVDALAGEVCDDGNTVSGDGCSGDCNSLEICGNHVVDAVRGEVCDDGNTVSGDGCSSDCKSKEICGNAIVDVAELCDLGSANSNAPDSACRTNCKLPVCGDAITDPQHGEACDNGVNNADTKDKCRTNCQLPRCGDKIVDTGEVCDDGNTTSGDGCSADCKSLEVCGNSIVDVAKGEQCDNGGANSNAPNAACRTNCTRRQCGDTIVDNTFGEVCDLGVNNSDLPDASCRTNCLPARCGDAIRDTGEVCDDGNTTSGDGCSSTCKSLEVCGNGIIDTVKGEQCDNGGLNSDSPNATCRTSCQRQQCGDSIIDTAFGEACDLGAANSNAADAACRTNCQPQRCGDHILDTGEICDDGNNTSGDGCSADCKSTEICGNSVVDTAKGEQCDAGSANSNAPNAPCRTTCKLPTCGDGIIDTARGEQCDAGTSNSNAPNSSCRTTCFLPRCGDGIVDNLAGEVCDDGNNTNGDGCASDCKSNETCGNGIVDFVRGETCDDGNTRPYDGCSACQPETEIVLSPNQTPGARSGAAIAYDGARQRVVLFGGKSASGNLGDTWEWDGVSWTKMVTVHAPSSRYAAAMAYDAKRHRIVLFGGTTTNPGASDTWEYDGVDWTQKQPAAQPGGRSDAAMAFDANTGRIVMFGGTADGTTGTAITYAYDGTTWATVTSGTPSARFGAKMTFDSAHGYVVMFGGNSGDTHTYTFDGAAWTDRGSTGGPATGSDVTAMAFDANVHKAVISDSSASTYEWSGSAWTAVAGAPATSRTAQAMTFDALRKQLVLFGGTAAGAPLAETWLRSTQTWSQPVAPTLPSARMRGAAAYDPVRKRVVLFGGQNTAQRRASCGATCMSADTWEWDGRKWAQASPSASPQPRAGSWLAYDPVGRVMKMYGGDSWVGGSSPTLTTYNDVWNYTGATWTQVGTTGTRTVARTAAMAFDSAANRVVTFGGVTGESATGNNQYGTTVGETWYWDGSWHQNTSAGQPGFRDNGQMAYDPVRNKTVMFSGNPRNGTTADDTWEWNNASWTMVANNVGPASRFNSRLVFNPDTSHVTLFGNSGVSTGEDVWEWNGTTWTQRAQSGTYASRYAPAAAYDAVNHEIVAFGGRNNDLQSFVTTQDLGLFKSRPNATAEVCTSAQVDYDNDGLAGCADDECWSVCKPLCPPGVTCAGTAPRCGDGTCSATEDCRICPTDCGACTGSCGDFNCDSGESHATCPNDC